MYDALTTKSQLILTLYKFSEYTKQHKVISVTVGKSPLGLICLLLVGPQKTVRHYEESMSKYNDSPYIQAGIKIHILYIYSRGGHDQSSCWRCG